MALYLSGDLKKAFNLMKSRLSVKLGAVLARLRFETGTIVSADQNKISASMEELTTIPLF